LVREARDAVELKWRCIEKTRDLALDRANSHGSVRTSSASGIARKSRKHRVERTANEHPAATEGEPVVHSADAGIARTAKRTTSDQSQSSASIDARDGTPAQAARAREKAMIEESNLAQFVKLRGASSAVPTERELQIIACIAQGLSTRETATKLFISIKTVETHRARIRRKLKARNDVDIARWAAYRAPHCITCTCVPHDGEKR
jgi:DNA-binding CsgD family transcriptional regulator